MPVDKRSQTQTALRSNLAALPERQFAICWWRFKRGDSGYVATADALTDGATLTAISRATGACSIGRVHDHPTEPTKEVSENHASIRFTDEGEPRISDCGSRNGTFVDGVRLNAGPAGEVPLRGGSLIGVGKEWLGIVVDGGESGTFSAGERPFTSLHKDLYVGPSLKRILAPFKAELHAWVNLDRGSGGLPAVVIEAEQGCGKDRVARALSTWSRREYHSLSCPGIAKGLAEAQIFGSQGKVVGGDAPTPGAFRDAHGGALLLDDIDDLPLDLQAKLLRVLQEGEVVPLGAVRPQRVDVLVIGATKRSLRKMAARDEFRDDLRGRLEKLAITIPPLRDRREEIPFLLGAFLKDIWVGARPLVERRFLERLCLHAWPHNVRQLRNLIEKLAIHAKSVRILNEAMVPRAEKLVSGTTAPTTASAPAPAPSSQRATPRNTAEMERLIAEHGGALDPAAAAIGMDRSTFRRLIDRLAPTLLHKKERLAIAARSEPAAHRQPD